MARGLIGLPALGWATGAAGVAALAIAGFGVFASAAGLGDDISSPSAIVDEPDDRDDADEATLQPRPGSIEFEAVLVSTNPYPNHTGHTEARHTWHAAPGLERCESLLVAPAEQQGPEVTLTTTTVIADGLARRLTATQRDFGSGPGSPGTRLTEHEAATAPPFCAGDSFARVPIGATLADVVQGIRGRSYPDTVVAIEGAATLLDRTVAVVSYAFVRDGMPEPGEPTVIEETGRIWFDEALGLVLKSESAWSSGHTNSFEVTRLVLDGAMDDALFTLDVPPDAEVRPASNSAQIVFALDDGTQTELAFLEEPGTYVPIGQPDGWRLSSAEATPGAPEDNGALTFPYIYSYSLGSALSVSTLWLTQEYPAEGLDPIFASAPVLMVDRYEARVHDAGDNKLLVSWMIDGEAAGVSTIRVTATLWNVDLAEFQRLFPLMFAIHEAP